MNVKIKKLRDEAIIPHYAKKGDAGMDLTAIGYEYDIEKNCHIYHTGLAMEIPAGYVGLIFPRSSNCKTNAYLTNSVGVIDSGYRGEIMICFKNRDSNTDEDESYVPYTIGSRVAQLIIMPYPQIEFKVSTSHTGKKASLTLHYRAYTMASRRGRVVGLSNYKGFFLIITASTYIIPTLY